MFAALVFFVGVFVASPGLAQISEDTYYLQRIEQHDADIRRNTQDIRDVKVEPGRQPYQATGQIRGLGYNVCKAVCAVSLNGIVQPGRRLVITYVAIELLLPGDVHPVRMQISSLNMEAAFPIEIPPGVCCGSNPPGGEPTLTSFVFSRPVSLYTESGPILGLSLAGTTDLASEPVYVSAVLVGYTVEIFPL
jgi:hypothetical protein